MKKSAVLSFLTTFILTVSFHYTLFAQNLQRYSYNFFEMGVPINIIFYGKGDTVSQKQQADQAAKRAFDRISQLNLVFSDYQPDSELRIACVKAQSGEEVVVSDDFWTVLTASQKYYRLSKGAFDPTVAGAVKLWRRARREEKMPRADLLAQAKRLTNFSLITLNEKNKSMKFAEKGIRLDFGGIAKGYIIDQSLKILVESGFPSAMVDIGGDVGLADAPPAGCETGYKTDSATPESEAQPRGWKVGILTPEGKNVAEYKYLSRCAVATSGDTERFVIIDGVKYSHIIDPKTGLGLTHSVVTTVIAPTAMEADAWASARSVDPKLPEIPGENNP